MLLPVDAAVGWAVVGLFVGALLAYYRRRWPIWCGLGASACGVISYWTVMSTKPLHYYPVLELLAAGLAMSVGVVGIAAYGLWLWSPLPPSRPTTRNAEPGDAPDPHLKAGGGC